MRVWVTRSQPGADRLAQALRSCGYQVTVAPVIDVEPTNAPRPHGRFQQVIFLSEHAVRLAAGIEFCGGARVSAVGGATARALEERGVSAEVPANSSSEGLLLLFSDEKVTGCRVLIVAGEGGRKVLRDTLLARGARVCEYLCYRRLANPVPDESLRSVDAILIASQDGFRHVARLWFDSGGSAEISVIAASGRIAGLAAELGFKNVQISGGGAASDWIAALEQGRGL